MAMSVVLKRAPSSLPEAANFVSVHPAQTSAKANTHFAVFSNPKSSWHQNGLSTSGDLTATRLQGIAVRRGSHSSRIAQAPKRRFCRAAIGPSATTSPVIDVEGVAKPIKLVVLGGNGFVGSHVVQAALQKGYEVTSINRSGRPTVREPWVDQAQWITADVFANDLEAYLAGASAVMSCLGGFGSNEQMERICGDANVRAVEAAKDAGVPRFIFVSVQDYNLPSFVKDGVGYFVGKKKAENRIRELYPTSGVILRPGFIYGSRRVPQANNLSIPLTPIGVVLDKSLSILPKGLTKALGNIPGSDVLIAPPVDVEDVARAAVEAVRNQSLTGVLDIEVIKRTASMSR